MRRRATPTRACCVSGALAIVVAVGPFVLDTYLVNTLIRAFHYALVALTVDILWGYAGVLTFGQAAFFGIGRTRPRWFFTHIGFSPRDNRARHCPSAAAPALSAC